jgi:chaperonin GroEL
MSYKQLLFNQDARDKIKKGVNIVADAVASTLGPRGQNVIFEESSYPTITKDGVTVASQVFLEDKFENMGNMISREAAENTNREAGDGTTTTIVLLREIFNEGFKAISTGMNPVLIKRGMDDALEQVLTSLDNQTRLIKTDTEKEQVAIISANNDKDTGKLISDVIKNVGIDGVITVAQSNSLKTEVEYVKGTKINSGYESHLFINDPRKLACVMENPEIILTTERISLSSQLVPLIQNCLEHGKRNLILLADTIEGQAIAFLVQNYLQGKFTCVPIKIPSFGGYQRDMIYDLAKLTEATVIGEQDAKRIEQATVEDLGKAEKVIVSRNQTIFSGTKGDVSGRIEETKALLEVEKDAFAREKLKQRIGRLSGSIANIKVGGASESEQIEIRYRMEDAINATKSAIEEGVVEGGGIALLNASKDIVLDISYGEEYKIGQLIIQKALSSPLKKIVDNGGISGEAVLAKVLETNLGYNALTNKYEDLFEAGIIDPKKVVRNEITNAIATAGILLTSGCAIAVKPKKDE